MTYASKICNLINYNPDTWREIIAEKRIFTKEKGPLVIFNYGINANFYDPIVREARGIIINVEEKKVVCWPFTKFTEYNNDCADEIDWDMAIVQEKIDGSIIKLWFDEITHSWVFSTNSMINAEDAPVDQERDITFMDVIKKTNEYKLIKEEYLDHEKLDESFTYIFELTSPLTEVCVKHEDYKLYHLGTRSNITGAESDYKIPGMPTPKVFNSSMDDISLNYLVNAVSALNTDNNKVKGCTCEGFVVVDYNWNRIKIKSPIYILLQDLLSGTKRSRLMLLVMLHDKTIDVDDVCTNNPRVAHIIKYYDFKYTELMRDLEIFVNRAKRLYEYVGKNMKELAKRMPECKFTSIAFQCINTDKTPIEVLESRHKGFIGSIEPMIPIYMPETYYFNYDGIGSDCIGTE